MSLRFQAPWYFHGATLFKACTLVIFERGMHFYAVRVPHKFFFSFAAKGAIKLTNRAKAQLDVIRQTPGSQDPNSGGEL